MHTLAIFLVNRIMAERTALRDPGLDIFEELTGFRIAQLADFVGGVAIDAKRRFTDATGAGSFMGAIFSEIALLAVAASAGFVDLFAYISPV